MQRQENNVLIHRPPRTRTRSHAELVNLGLTPQNCTVGTALAFCGYATNEVDRDAQAHTLSLAPLHTRALSLSLSLSHTHTHTHTHARTHTCTRSSYSTQAARKASTRMQQQW